MIVHEFAGRKKMPTDPRALAAIAESLTQFVAAYGLEDRPIGPLTFPNDEWRMLSAGQHRIIFRRPETQAALEAFHKRFKRKDWRERWSPQFLNDAELQALGDSFSDPSEAGI